MGRNRCIYNPWFFKLKKIKKHKSWVPVKGSDVPNITQGMSGFSQLTPLVVRTFKL